MSGRWMRLAGLGLALALGHGPVAAQEDAELDRHLATLRQQLEEQGRDVGQRERLALELAGTLDRAAKSARTVEARRARWAEAVELLDRFNARNPQHSQKDQFEFQAAVFLWAQAESLSQQLEQAPTDAKAREESIRLLDEAIRRLGSIATPGGRDNPLAQNVRFRLAQALADRARFEREDTGGARPKMEEALDLLEKPFTDPTLQGFALLIRAGLHDQLGRHDAARAALDAAAKLDPPPPPAALAEARVELALSGKRFDEALKAARAAPVGEGAKDLLALRVRLAEAAEGPEGPGRQAAEAEAFRLAEGLRRRGGPEARSGLMRLARAVKAPAADAGPEAWETLAEGQLALGDPRRAAELEDRAAAAADRLGQPDRAAAARYRAAAIQFRAGRFAEADALLSKVAADPKAGPVRPKASLLRILARGRGLALSRSGFTRERYRDALAGHLKDFPDDPTAGEARWLLGQVRLGAGEPTEAAALWSKIGHGDPRWLESRLAIARVDQDALDAQLLNGDPVEARRRRDEARRQVREAAGEAGDDAERVALELAEARLDLTPTVGDPERAREACERVLKTAARVEQRNQARRLRAVALAQSSRFVEAEREARAAAGEGPPRALLELARLLDAAASATDRDLYRRRFGQLMRIALAPLTGRGEGLTAAEKAEAQLLEARGLLFSGDLGRARRTLTALEVPAGSLPEGMLDDLADTYVRLDADAMAVDIYRLRAQQCRPGSLPWFAARYGMAMALSRSGHADEARRLIDATALLHPDLGGGELRGKFERLRQRLGQE